LLLPACKISRAANTKSFDIIHCGNLLTHIYIYIFYLQTFYEPVPSSQDLPTQWDCFSLSLCNMFWWQRMTRMFQYLHIEQSGPKWLPHSWLIFAGLEFLFSILMIKVKSCDALYLLMQFDKLW
jgi:hypothetical protein